MPPQSGTDPSTVIGQILLQVHDSHVALAMAMAPFLEGGGETPLGSGGWGVGDNGNSYGPYQINMPYHPTMTRQTATNPADAVRYMLPSYEQAVNQVPDSEWQSSPEQAAEHAIFLAERPAEDYYVTHGSSGVDAAYRGAESALKGQGSFGSSLRLPRMPYRVNTKDGTFESLGQWKAPLDVNRLQAVRMANWILAVRRKLTSAGVIGAQSFVTDRDVEIAHATLVPTGVGSGKQSDVSCAQAYIVIAQSLSSVTGTNGDIMGGILHFFEGIGGKAGGAVGDAVGWAKGLAGIISWLTNVSNWKRIGLMVLGAIILIFAAWEGFKAVS